MVNSGLQENCNNTSSFAGSALSLSLSLSLPSAFTFSIYALILCLPSPLSGARGSWRHPIKRECESRGKARTEYFGDQVQLGVN
jgi:hypothetical protein